MIRDRVRDGDVVFEPGCGVLALLCEIKRRYPQVTLHGMEPSEVVMARLWSSLSPEEADHFFLGRLPEGMARIADATFDVLVCNSVLQYMVSDQVEFAIREMIRVTKPGRHVLLGGICDMARRDEIEQAVAHVWKGTLIEGDEGLTRTYFERAWWQRFADDGHRVEILERHLPSLKNRGLRYNVHIEIG